jgi:surface antigen
VVIKATVDGTPVLAQTYGSGSATMREYSEAITLSHDRQFVYLAGQQGGAYDGQTDRQTDRQKRETDTYKMGGDCLIIR